MTPNMQRIVKVLAVVDTRRYEEVEPDKWKPIPGTGIENECARCGRMHEVHVQVCLEDETTAIVGSSCCRQESMEIQSRIRSAVSAAMTAARLSRELETARAKYSAFTEKQEEIRRDLGSRNARVYGNSEPAIKKTTREVIKGYRKGQIDHVLVMGDVEVTLWEGQHGKPDSRDFELLDRYWEEKRLKEAGFDGRDYLLKEIVDDLAKRLARAEKRAAGD